jgi:lipoprotein-anchoring transpeptidase ErfK/SrfK
MSSGLGPDVDGPRRNRHVLWAAPLAVAGAVAVAVVVVSAVSHGASTAGNGAVAAGTGQATASSAPSGSTPSGSAASRSTAPTGPVATVHVTSALNDGEVVGVGEPIVLSFSPAPTDSSAFTRAASVTVNGAPAIGAWYWERPYAGQPVQAHFRERTYWPAHATIHVTLPISGMSAGKGLAYSGALSSVTFRTGDAHVSTVDAATLTMTVTDNGTVVKTVPVSLGKAATPTYNGTKIVMQKGEDVPGTNTLRPQGTVMMSGPHYTNDPVPWSVRVTASGEYVHAAGWNTHIGTSSTSNGCTNLKPADGQWFYEFSQLGDVVTYLHTDGTRMNPIDGLGDWNIAWSQWSRGGLLITH